MSLTPRGPIELPIVGGVDEGTDARSVTTLSEVRNMVYRKRGGLAKRYGSKRLTTRTSTVPGTLSTGVSYTAAAQSVPEMVCAYGDRLVVVGEGRCYTWASTSAAGTTAYADYASMCTVTRDGVAFDQAGALGNPTGSVVSGYQDGDCATDGIVTLFAYWQPAAASAGTLFISVQDNTTKAWIFNKYNIDTTATIISARPRVFVCGSTFVIVYATGINTIKARTWALGSAAVSAASTLASDLQDASAVDTGGWDACAFNATEFFFAYLKSSGTDRIIVSRIAVSGFAVSKSAAIPSSGSTYTGAIAIDATINAYWVAWGVHVSSDYIVRFSASEAPASTGSTFTATAPVDASSTADVDCAGFTNVTVKHLGFTNTGGPDSYRAMIAWSYGVGHADASDSTFGMRVVKSNSGVTSTAGSIVTSRGILQSRIFSKTSTYDFYSATFFALALYRPVITSSTAGYRVLMVLELGTSLTSGVATTPRVHAVSAPRFSGDFRTFSCLSGAAAVSSTAVVLAANVNPNAPQIAGVSALRVSFDQSERMSCVTPHGLCVLSGGIPAAFDGQNVLELGYTSFPEVLTAGSQTTGGSLTLLTSYLYRGVYESRDANGNVLMSAVSPALTATALTGSNNKQTITFPALNLGRRASPPVKVACVLYRLDVASGIYYRAAEATIVNASDSIVNVIDSLSDAAIRNNAELYTTGDVLDNVCPPSAALVAVYRNRIWLAGTDDDSIWPSKQLVYGEVPGFNEGLRIPAFGRERKTGMVVLDEKLVLFEPNAIYLLTGDVATDDGNAASSTYQIELISSDSGCIDPRSVIATSAGVFYRSIRGMMLLDRSLQTSFIGEAVLDSLPSTVRVTDAVLVPAFGQVRFPTVTIGGTSGDELVFDLTKNAWTKNDRYDTTDSALRAVGAACMHQDAYTFASCTGQLFKEDTTTWLDTAHWVTATFTTGWFSSAGKQGAQRVRRVGLLGQKYTGTVGFTLALYADFDESTADTYSKWADATGDGYISAGAFSVQAAVVRQKCQSFRLKFTDNTIDGSSNRGLEISSVSVEFGTYDNQYRNRSANRMG